MTWGAACVSRGPSVTLPQSRLDLTGEAPPLPTPPRTGPFDSTASREVRIVVAFNGRDIEVAAFCRVGVWTTLDSTRAYAFVTRETWGRLEERRPRRLRRVLDQALAGVTVRVRPEPRGELSFQAEVAQVTMAPMRTVDLYHGQRIALSEPSRHGFRFWGSVPPGHLGLIAGWGDVTVHLAERGDVPPRGALRFRAGEEAGLVAGERAAAETFAEAWVPKKPIHIVADDIERKDYRLAMERRAAGFRVGTSGSIQQYGDTFEFTRVK